VQVHKRVLAGVAGRYHIALARTCSMESGMPQRASGVNNSYHRIPIFRRAYRRRYTFSLVYIVTVYTCFRASCLHPFFWIYLAVFMLVFSPPVSLRIYHFIETFHSLQKFDLARVLSFIRL